MVVILSGYRDFKYAQTALKLGVSDYLLKPVAADELKLTLEKCEKSAKDRKNAFGIADIMKGGGMARFGEALHYLVYLVLGGAAAEAGGIIPPSGLYVPSHEVEEKIQSLTGEGQTFCFIGVYLNEKALILPKGSMTDQVLAEKLTDLASWLKNKYKYAVTAAYRLLEIGGSIGAGINECRKIAARSVLIGVNRVVSELPPDKHKAANLDDLIDFISLCLRQGRFSGLRERLDKQFSLWMDEEYPLRFIQNDLIYITNSVKHSILAADSGEYAIADYIGDIASVSGNMQELAENYYNLLLDIIAPSGSEQQTMPVERIVEKIERYFHQNLSKEITLSMLSAEMNYSKFYLCRIFKKYRNTSPIDSFIQMKIDKAQSLFREFPDISMKSISDSLGFSDVYYFSKVFKRVTGFTPSAVRDKSRAGEEL
jgi:YesN/AraC family two-component response regulator